MENKITNGEQASVGVFVAVTMITIVLVLTFGWAPASFVLGKWNGFWDGLGASHAAFTVGDSSADYKRYLQAGEECKRQARAYYGSEYFSVVASTSDQYSTYECVGVALEKIPDTHP